MLKQLTLSSILFFTLMFSPTINAVWWFSPNGPGGYFISDNPLEIKLGNMPCGVTKTDYSHMENSDYIVESRKLYCKMADGTLVAIIATCHLPEYEVQQLLIGEGPNGHYPMLGCSPAKKK